MEHETTLFFFDPLPFSRSRPVLLFPCVRARCLQAILADPSAFAAASGGGGGGGDAPAAAAKVEEEEEEEEVVGGMSMFGEEEGGGGDY